MIRMNFIELLQTKWAPKIVFTAKKDVTLCFYGDYRKLNAVMVRHSYPIPRIDDCLDSLEDAVVFSSLDSDSGYFQIYIEVAGREKNAITSYHGLYRFVRIPLKLRT